MFIVVIHTFHLLPHEREYILISLWCKIPIGFTYWLTQTWKTKLEGLQRPLSSVQVLMPQLFV